MKKHNYIALHKNNLTTINNHEVKYNYTDYDEYVSHFGLYK